MKVQGTNISVPGQRRLREMFSWNTTGIKLPRELRLIAKDLGISTERVHQLYRRALWKMMYLIQREAERRNVTPEEWLRGEYSACSPDEEIPPLKTRKER